MTRIKDYVLNLTTLEPGSTVVVAWKDADPQIAVVVQKPSKKDTSIQVLLPDKTVSFVEVDQVIVNPFVNIFDDMISTVEIPWPIAGYRLPKDY